MVWTDGEIINAAKLNGTVYFGGSTARLEHETDTEVTVRLVPIGKTDDATEPNKRMALHIQPSGTGGGATFWGAALGLWNRQQIAGDGKAEVMELTWESDQFLFNVFASGGGTVRDLIFASSLGETGGEVARMVYNTGAGTQRFRLKAPQIPNTSALATDGRLYFLDNAGLERVQMYCYDDDNFTLESKTAGHLKFKTSEAAGTVDLDRLWCNGGAAQGFAGINVYENLKMQTNGGLYQSIELPVKAGALGDADFNDPQDGLIGIDSANFRIYFRYGGAWHHVNQTAGFQIPKEEKKCKVCGKSIKKNDFVCGQIDGKMNDGALHGLYVHLKCALKESQDG